MEPLTLKPRTPVESPDVENWDDDDFDSLEDVQFRAVSTATSVVSHPQANHRDSVSSRMSMRSESNQGDENWDVLVDEQAPIKDAIALAKSKGIPLPSNVPRSALEGGTIRRLKGKEIKKAITDDWSDDLDLPGADTPLKLVKPDDRELSESLRQISAAFRASPKSPDTRDMLDQTIRSPKSRSSAMPVTLDAFRDTDEDAGFTDVPTIKVAKHRSLQKPLLFQQPPTPVKADVENIEEDLEVPSDGQLRLSTRKPPSTPHQSDDFDLEWAEGSLGTRNAGRRGGRSARSSSASALSPSVSSAFTAESEDEGLDGLILPDGPIKFEDKLKQRHHNRTEDSRSVRAEKPDTRASSGKDDFFSGLELGDGEVFDAAKLTLNRNIKHKTTRPPSPSKRSTTTLNFTSTKTQTTISRLPRFQPAHDRHERARPNLEPVSETGAISSYQRSNSRLGNHGSHASVSSIPAPATPSTPSTPSRRLLRPAESRPDLRYEQQQQQQPTTTTNAQLLRAKRSMPVMRNMASPTKASPYVRPPSRQDMGSRLNLPGRPRTPTDRADLRMGEIRKGTTPFLPAGASAVQSQHASIKTTTSARHHRGQDSDGSEESMSAAQRSLSRLAGLGRPETPGRGRPGLTPAELAAQAKKAVTKPARRRNYGDGTELEIFDDLPTSATVESKFTKAPIARGAPRSLRSKLGLSHLNPSTSSLSSTRRGSDTPVPATPATPLSPLRGDFPTTALNTTNVPRFARDTAASRNAREQRQVSTTFQNMRGEPLRPISTNWSSTAPARSNQNSLRKKKGDKLQLKPHLIKPLGHDLNRPKSEKGMHYNPFLFRWEGNENDLAPFDVPDFHPRGASPAGGGQDSPRIKTNVALISNVGSSVNGVQVVGGMVFDPSQMRWLKIAENPDGTTSSLRGGSVKVEEEEDVFAGLEDLQEEDETRSRSGTLQNVSGSGTRPKPRDSFGEDAGHSSGDEWGVSEEFDVGPEFVRRQRSEEERWRRKVEKWLRRGMEAEEDDEGLDGRSGWRWAIRELVMEQGERA